MDPLVEEVVKTQATMFNPFTFVINFVATYGWFILGGGALVLYVAHKLRPRLDKWRQAREDAEYHKDPDKVQARMDAVQRAREKQQEMLLLASQRAAELQKEREEKKRAEALELLEKYGSTAGGQRLGSPGDDYLPLSGGPSSSYKPPKRSTCSKGGCGG